MGVGAPRRPWGLLAVLTTLSLAAAGCREEILAPQVIEETSFATALGIDLSQMTRLPSGVYIRDDLVGGGALLTLGDSATVDLTGWLSNATVFAQGQLEFVYGTTDLTEGFDIGLAGIAVGGRRWIIVPPALGYGDSPPLTTIVPAGAILVFEVELVSIP
jgi:FKBP-type peptidyl-prolyl cis-trans isomerase